MRSLAVGAVIALAAACGDHGQAIDLDAAVPDARPDAGTMLACTHEEYLETLLADAVFDSCGDLPGRFHDPDAALAALYGTSRDCMSAAISGERSFAVSWDSHGIDSFSTYSWVGVRAGETWSYSRLESGIGKDGKPTGVYRITCEALVPVVPCPENSLFYNLCFTCEGWDVSRVCAPQ